MWWCSWCYPQLVIIQVGVAGHYSCFFWVSLLSRQFGLVLGLLGGSFLPWSESDSLSLGTCWRTLFLAVGGPINGLLFLPRRPWCRWSSSSSKEVARFRVAVLRSKIWDRRTDEEGAFNCIGSASSSELPPEDWNGDTLLLSSLRRLAAGLLSVRGGGFAKSERGNASPGGVGGRRGAGCGLIVFV